MLTIKDEKDGIVFSVFVLPRSSRNMVVGIHNGAIKLKLTAPPVDNAANKECAAFLSKVLKVPKSSISIVTGQTNRNKQLMVHLPGKKDPKTERAELHKRILCLF